MVVVGIGRPSYKTWVFGMIENVQEAWQGYFMLVAYFSV